MCDWGHAIISIFGFCFESKIEMLKILSFYYACVSWVFRFDLA